MFILLLLATFLSSLIKRLKFSFWSGKNVINVPPKSILEHSGLRRTKSVFDEVIDIYREYPNERYVGTYSLGTPVLMIKDPQLIKQITIIDNDSFANRRQFSSPELDTSWSKNVLAATGNRWHELRQILNPIFSGNNIENLFKSVQDCTKKCVDFYAKQDEDLIRVEIEDIFTKLGSDIAAKEIFDRQVDSQASGSNVFYLKAKKLAGFSGTWNFWIHLTIPFLGRLLRLSLLPKDVCQYFSSILENTIQFRKESKVKKNDILQSMIDSKTNTTEKNTTILSFEDICAQSYLLLYANSKILIPALNFMAYELAVNKDVQEKLFSEIEKANKVHINYDEIDKLKYLDMVVAETLRKWPSHAVSDREVTKKYTIEPKNPTETPLTLEPGTLCWLPIAGLHRDENYFENPDVFDPERFDEKNIIKIKPYTYLPFGQGPRSCLGSKFALLQMKVMFFYILLNFKIVPTELTKIPVILESYGSLPAAKNGMNLALKRRKAV